MDYLHAILAKIGNECQGHVLTFGNCEEITLTQGLWTSHLYTLITSTKPLSQFFWEKQLASTVCFPKSRAITLVGQPHMISNILVQFQDPGSNTSVVMWNVKYSMLSVQIITKLRAIKMIMVTNTQANIIVTSHKWRLQYLWVDVQHKIFVIDGHSMLSVRIFWVTKLRATKMIMATNPQVKILVKSHNPTDFCTY